MNESRRIGHGRLKRKEVLLMLIPVLLLVGVGIALRSKKRAVIVPPSNRFILAVEDVKIKRVSPSPPSKAGEEAIRVTVVVGHQGPTPAWWGYAGGTLTGLRFVGKSGREYKAPRWVGTQDPVTHGNLTAARKEYVLNYTCVIPKSHEATEQDVFKATVVMELGPTKKLGSVNVSAVVPGEGK